MFREICYRIAWFCAALWGASWLGMLHPVGDSLATFRPIWAVAVGLFALVAWSRHRRASLWLGLFAGIALGVTAVTWGAGGRVVQATAEAAPAFRLYQNNLLYRQNDHALTLANLEALAPDVVTFQEVSEGNLPLLDRLKPLYPYQAFCPYGTVGGVAVLSKLEPTDAEPVCVYPKGLVGLQVTTPLGPVWVVAVHAKWPYPFNDTLQITEMVAALERLRGDVVMAGDFNMVAGTHRLRRLARAAGMTRLPGWVPTFALPHPDWALGYPVQIDHVFATLEGRVRAAPRSGSDHVPLVADFW